jgi:hypothetical protein
MIAKRKWEKVVLLALEDIDRPKAMMVPPG